MTISIQCPSSIQQRAAGNSAGECTVCPSSPRDVGITSIHPHPCCSEASRIPPPLPKLIQPLHMLRLKALRVPKMVGVCLRKEGKGKRETLGESRNPVPARQLMSRVRMMRGIMMMERDKDEDAAETTVCRAHPERIPFVPSHACAKRKMLERKQKPGPVFLCVPSAPPPIESKNDAKKNCAVRPRREEMLVEHACMSRRDIAIINTREVSKEKVETGVSMPFASRGPASAGRLLEAVNPSVRTSRPRSRRGLGNGA
jgi:hypothetical protein